MKRKSEMNWETQKQVKGYFEIGYADAKGDKTTRGIVVNKIHFSKDGNFVIGAHCELRDAYKSFRGDRIVSCVNLKDGEIIDDLFQYLYNKPIEFSPDKALIDSEEYELLLQIMVYICNVDKVFKDEEFDKLHSYFSLITENDNIPFDVLRGMIDRLPKTKKDDFPSLLDLFLKSDIPEKGLLVSFCVGIAKSDNEFHKSEKQAIDLIMEKIKRKEG